jgi:tetratricopeptide (TPR) repeat protein
VADFNKALELDPDMEEIYWYRADAYRALNNLEQALKDYRRAAATDPEDSILFLNQGTILMMMGRYEEALEMLRRSIVLDPDNLPSYAPGGAALRTVIFWPPRI